MTARCSTIATNRSLTRTNLSQKRPAASRKKQPKEKNELSTIKAKLTELTTLMKVFSESENKTRIAFYPRVSSTDSCRANPARPNSHSKKRRQKRKALKNQYKQNNDRYIKNLSDTTLTDQDKTLLSKGLKFIPTRPKPNSHRSLIKDFNNFTRNMRLKFLFAYRNSKPHPFDVKSNWQPSVALENYLERTKYEIATISFCDTYQEMVYCSGSNSTSHMKTKGFCFQLPLINIRRESAKINFKSSQNCWRVI